MSQVTAILCLLCLLAGPISAQNAELLWQRGSAYFERHDYRAALPVLKQAATLGHARAQALLGIMYQDGDGVPADDFQAAHWFGLAAKQGHRASQYALGAMYEEGEGGLPKDVAKAASYYAMSARQGYDKAQFALGISYEFGQGVPRNRDTAIALLNAAAAQGEGRAGWISTWLRDRRTPAFKDENELGYYIISKISNWTRTAGGSLPSGCSGMRALGCAQAMEERRIRQNNIDAGIKVTPYIH